MKRHEESPLKMSGIHANLGSYYLTIIHPGRNRAQLPNQLSAKKTLMKQLMPTYSSSPINFGEIGLGNLTNTHLATPTSSSLCPMWTLVSSSMFPPIPSSSCLTPVIVQVTCSSSPQASVSHQEKLPLPQALGRLRQSWSEGCSQICSASKERRGHT